MRRTFAVALAVGVLLLGGCDRQPAQSSGPPAATDGTAPTIGKSTRAGGTTSAGGQPTANGADDVDSLLSDVDKHLNSDSQPTKDAD